MAGSSKSGTSPGRSRLTQAWNDTKWKVKGWLGIKPPPPVMVMGDICVPPNPPVMKMGILSATPTPPPQQRQPGTIGPVTPPAPSQ